VNIDKNKPVFCLKMQIVMSLVVAKYCQHSVARLETCVILATILHYWGVISYQQVCWMRVNRVSTAPGNPGNLLEFVWSSWKFCVKCRRSTALVSSHDETWYRIAYLRNWSILSLPRPPCCACHVFVLYLGKLVIIITIIIIIIRRQFLTLQIYYKGTQIR